MTKILLLVSTIRHLKSKQVFFQFYYRVRKIVKKKKFINTKVFCDSETLLIERSIYNPESFDDYSFSFLNEKIIYPKEQINWNESRKGKLWTYNLNYFDFLNQERMSKKQGLLLIENYIKEIETLGDGMDAYPISLRGINWIKFLTNNSIKNKEINSILNLQYKHLLKNIEYHLLGNHLLENGFSLLWAAYYFNDKCFYKKASSILIDELNEQILDDGGHFELSPMYHQIILYRLLDCINLIQNNSKFNDNLLFLFKKKANKMLSWINKITFDNGQIPLLNDSSVEIAPSTEKLNHYASILSINNDQDIELNDSGYRKITNKTYELLIDIGNIGPSYIPGHAHSDTFNFVLHSNSQPIIIDPGISTYEKNKQRFLERSTESHNTVKINNLNQSEVWGGFRVGRRAYTRVINESEGKIIASHNGYRSLGITHTRDFNWDSENIEILDSIVGNKVNLIESCLHFAPGLNPKLEENIIKVENLIICFYGVKNVWLEKYACPIGYNKFQESLKAKMECEKNVKIHIEINN